MPINMSHCRFYNTLAALRECSETLAVSEHRNPIDGLSDEEKKAAQKLLKLCGELAADYGEDAA